MVFESLIVNEYLDELYPETAILPTDPYERAQQKILVERLSSVRLASAYQLNSLTKCLDTSGVLRIHDEQGWRLYASN